jgi:hypothetical protein
MTLAELKRAKNQRPFRPFFIRMADGREIEITHPDAVAREGEGSHIVICITPGGGWEIVDLILATSLDMAAPQSAVETKQG